jgi:tetratricopeptide (TPR) repeat protein
VTRLVLARLAGLGPDAEHLARVAALVGDGADCELVRATARLEPLAFTEAARRLGGADLVTVEPRVAFLHPVSRAAIAASVAAEERAALSRRAADLLAERGDLDAVAGHLLAIPPAADQEAVATLRRAAARALGRGAPETAVALLQRALIEPPDADVEATVLHELGLAEVRTSAAIAPVHLRAALERTPPGPERARLADHLARALHSLNQSREAAAVAVEALAETAPGDRAASGCSPASPSSAGSSATARRSSATWPTRSPPSPRRACAPACSRSARTTPCSPEPRRGRWPRARAAPWPTARSPARPLTARCPSSSRAWRSRSQATRPPRSPSSTARSTPPDGAVRSSRTPAR